MNRWLFVLVLASCFSATAQQSTFMIGADWFNPTHPYPNQYPYPSLSDNYWNRIQELGLNYGGLNSGYNSPATILNLLDKANVRGIKIFLSTYRLDAYRGRRWMYQIEDTQNDTINDFNGNNTGGELQRKLQCGTTSERSVHI